MSGKLDEAVGSAHPVGGALFARRYAVWTSNLLHRAYSIIVIPALAKHLDVPATSRICVLYFFVSVFVSGRLNSDYMSSGFRPKRQSRVIQCHPAAHLSINKSEALNSAPSVPQHFEAVRPAPA